MIISRLPIPIYGQLNGLRMPNIQKSAGDSSTTGGSIRLIMAAIPVDFVAVIELPQGGGQ